MIINKVEGKGCTEIYNAEVIANATNALVGYTACALGSAVCTGGYFACLSVCYGGVDLNNLAQNEAALARYKACLAN